MKLKSTNRNFGLLFAGLLTILSAYKAYYDSNAVLVCGILAIAVLIGLISIVAPALLSPFNTAWIMIGDLMGKIGNPLVLGIIFFLLITPIAILSRLCGRDELRIKKIKTNTYWINRSPPGPPGDSFKNQF